MARKSKTWVALLRGINVGGKNPLPMQALREVLEGLGLAEVATYVQSGNARFRAAKGEAELVPLIQQAIARRFALAVPVVVRSAEELAKAAVSNPFLAPGEAAAEALLPILQVGYLGTVPAAAAVAALDADRSPPDEFRVVGREVFMRCPNSLGRTRLTVDFFERGLGSTVTFRSWKTALALAAWVRGGS